MPVHRLWRCVFAALILSAGGLLTLPALLAQSDPERPYAVLTKMPSMAFEVWPADFNEDGITDLVAGRVSSDIVVAIGLGDGTFASERPIAAGVGLPVGVGDLNRDGFIDILSSIVQPNGTVTATFILSGNGNGTFAPAMASSLRVDAPAYVVDFNGDAVQDVVGLGIDEVRVYPGISDFMFGTPSVMRTGIMPANLVPADLNADGLVDVAAVTQEGRSVDLFINVGGFDFTRTTIPLGHQGLGITAGDMDRDGIIDLVASGGDLVGSVACDWASGFVFLLRGNGDGTFQSPVAFATNRGPRSVVIGDFNGDGRRDVATGNLSYGYSCDSFAHLWDSVSFLPGFGDGRLGPAASYALGNSEDPPDTTVYLYRRAHHRLNTSDLNADGRTDLIASPGAILLSTPPTENRNPVADAGESQMVPSGFGNIGSGGAPSIPTTTGSRSNGPMRPARWSALSRVHAFLKHRRRRVHPDRHGWPRRGECRHGDQHRSIAWRLVRRRHRPGGTSGKHVMERRRVYRPRVRRRHLAHIGRVPIRQLAGHGRLRHRHARSVRRARARLDEGWPDDPGRSVATSAPRLPLCDALFDERRRVPAAGDRRGATVHTSGPAVAPPVWLRLRREGDAIAAFARASESEPWALVGTQTFSGLPASVQVGLAVTSHADDTLATATFDNLSVTPVVPALPPGWTSIDVGAVGATGQATHDGATFTVRRNRRGHRRHRRRVPFRVRSPRRRLRRAGAGHQPRRAAPMVEGRVDDSRIARPRCRASLPARELTERSGASVAPVSRRGDAP